MNKLKAVLFAPAVLALEWEADGIDIDWEWGD